MLTPAFACGVPAERAVLIAPTGVVRRGEPQGRRVSEHSQRPLGKFWHGEQQVVVAEGVLLDVCRYLRDDLRAELELTMLLVLGIVLDEEAASLGMEPWWQFDDHPADRQDAGAEVEVPGPQFGELAPAQPALDVVSTSSFMVSDGSSR
jgi:hypothetical protein